MHDSDPIKIHRQRQKENSLYNFQFVQYLLFSLHRFPFQDVNDQLELCDIKCGAFRTQC